jgi:signal transduction histidine kinase
VSEIVLSGQPLTETDLLRVMAMLGAATSEHATRSAVDFTAHRLDVPVGGWVASADPSRLDLVGIRGLPPAASDEVLDRMATLPRTDVESERSALRNAEAFAAIAGVERAIALRAGPALLLIGTSPDAARSTVGLVRMMLETTLRKLTEVRIAERRNEQLDLSVAWTAHEIKSPLVGAMAALERARLAPDEDTDALLKRVQGELEQLAGLVDDLLNWAALGEPIRTQPLDLVPLVHEAVAACDVQRGAERVRVLAPRSPVDASVSPSHLRGALANVIRNALLYSPRGSVVQVTVASRDGLAWITVRDEGAGVPEGEREWIFDPFARGMSAPRGGKGLGLFITRRVIEAHGGAIWIEPSEEGTAFRIQLPARGRTDGEGSA